MLVFVGHQQVLSLLLLVLNEFENQISMVFTLGYVVVGTSLKVDCAPILNLLRLDSKQEVVQMCSTQQLVLIRLV
jgi:hypothetical protein